MARRFQALRARAAVRLSEAAECDSSEHTSRQFANGDRQQGLVRGRLSLLRFHPPPNPRSV